MNYCSSSTQQGQSALTENPSQTCESKWTHKSCGNIWWLCHLQLALDNNSIKLPLPAKKKQHKTFHKALSNFICAWAHSTHRSLAGHMWNVHLFLFIHLSLLSIYLSFIKDQLCSRSHKVSDTNTLSCVLATIFYLKQQTCSKFLIGGQLKSKLLPLTHEVLASDHRTQMGNSQMGWKEGPASTLTFKIWYTPEEWLSLAYVFSRSSARLVRRTTCLINQYTWFSG